MAPHCDGVDGIGIVLGGRLRETSGAREFYGGYLSVVAKPADVSHTTEFGPDGASLLSIRMPGRDPGAATESLAPLPRWTWQRRPELLPEIAGLIRAAGEFSCDAAEEAADGLREAVTLLVDAMNRPPHGAVHPPPAWLEGVRERLACNVTDATPVADLAADAGVSSTYLTRCFGRFYGRSVTAYRTLLRVRAAAAMLSAADLPPAAIALEAGFHDQSHLTRHFRRVTGTTPGAWRRLSGPAF
jgi:AraC-like DNA-binding protein